MTLSCLFLFLHSSSSSFRPTLEYSSAESTFSTLVLHDDLLTLHSGRQQVRLYYSRSISTTRSSSFARSTAKTVQTIKSIRRLGVCTRQFSKSSIRTGQTKTTYTLYSDNLEKWGCTSSKLSGFDHRDYWMTDRIVQRPFYTPSL